MIAIRVNYILGNVYNPMKENFIKNWKYKSFLGLYSSEGTPNLTNHEISESNIRCKICIKEMWKYVSKQLIY